MVGPWIFVLVGIGLCSYGCFWIWKIAASQSWPAVKGTILESWVARDQKKGDEEYGPSFSPKIRYHFFVGSMEYAGHRIHLYEKSMPRQSHAHDWIASYPRGAQVTVYYNPQNPSDCVLERKSGVVWWIVVLGAICILVGFYSW